MTNLGVSIITMSSLNLYQEIKILMDSGRIDYLHIDIMDGDFVPRYGIYPEIIKEISENFDIAIDVHLMVRDVEFAIAQLSEIEKVKTISFHHSTNEGRIFRIVDAIRSIGASPILALDLSTSILAVSELLRSKELDGLLFMGIHPGILNQEHRPDNVIRRLAELRDINNINELIIQIDGGFNFKTAKKLRNAGVNSFVAGSSSIYKDSVGIQDYDKHRSDIFTNIDRIKKLIG